MGGTRRDLEIAAAQALSPRERQLIRDAVDVTGTEIVSSATSTTLTGSGWVSDHHQILWMQVITCWRILHRKRRT